MSLPPAQAAIKMVGTAFPVVSAWTVKIKGEMWLSVPGFVLKPAIIWRSCTFPRIFSRLTSGLQLQCCSQWHCSAMSGHPTWHWDTQQEQPDSKLDVWTPQTTPTQSHVSSSTFISAQNSLLLPGRWWSPGCVCAFPVLSPIFSPGKKYQNPHSYENNIQQADVNTVWK